jgi:hypothetical protein
MTSLEKRMAKLSGRTSREAWLRLQKARQHPKFAELLAELETIDGAVGAADIQRALRRFLSQHPGKG